MNIKRIKSAIKMMENVRDKKLPFNMLHWQDVIENPKETKKEAISCGTACCFAGWLALEPAFKKAGGSIIFNGSPYFSGKANSDAIAEYLEIDRQISAGICAYGCSYYYEDENGNFSAYKDITPQMVINKLKDLLNSKT